MNDESVNKILKNIYLEETKQLPMTVAQRRVYDEVKVCIDILREDWMLPTPLLRDCLMEKLPSCSQRHAYDVIGIARAALGNRQRTTKNEARELIMESLRVANYLAQTFEPKDRVKALIEIASTLARAFATNVDDGDFFNAKQFLNIDTVNISLDPATIGIKISPTQQKEIDRLLKKYAIEDAEFEETETETPEAEAATE